MAISFFLLVNIVCAAEAASENIVATDKEAIQTKANKAGIETNSIDTLENHSQIGAANYLQMIMGLFGIIVFIFAIAWLIKRMGSLNPVHSNNLKVVAGLNVGQREKIIVVQVMDEQLLVGVTQSNIQLLSRLEQPLPNKDASSLGGFHEKFQAAISGLKNKGQQNKTAVADSVSGARL